MPEDFYRIPRPPAPPNTGSTKGGAPESGNFSVAIVVLCLLVIGAALGSLMHTVVRLSTARVTPSNTIDVTISCPPDVADLCKAMMEDLKRHVRVWQGAESAR